MEIVDSLIVTLGLDPADFTKGRKQAASGNGWGNVKGASLETVVTSKENGSVSTILVKEISTDSPSASLFDMTEYQVMEMPSLKDMMPFGKKR